MSTSFFQGVDFKIQVFLHKVHACPALSSPQSTAGLKQWRKRTKEYGSWRMRREKPLILAHPEGHNSTTMQCRAAIVVDRFSKIPIEKLSRSNLGLPHHTLRPGDSKVLLYMTAF